MQGKDCGEIKLRLTYAPLGRVNPLVGERGNFFVYPKKGRDFPRMVPKSAKSTNPYYVGKVGSEKKTGNTMYNTTVRASTSSVCTCCPFTTVPWMHASRAREHISESTSAVLICVSRGTAWELLAS